MLFRLKLYAKVLVVGMMGLAMAACANISKDIASDGSGAQEIVWPAQDSTLARYDGGTSPSLSAIRNIRPGMTKSEIADLIGYPQFNEGLGILVREWDYLFQLPLDNGWKTCQYKVLFDTHKLAQSFYWKPESCARLLEPVKKKPVPVAAIEPRTKSFPVSADVLFAFDSATLREKGRVALDPVVRNVKKHQDEISAIHIYGYTDVLGSTRYNRKLSLKRAQSVQRYLESQGVPADLMTAHGLGESDPVKTGCKSSGSRNDRAKCLAPNRRVRIDVTSG